MRINRLVQCLVSACAASSVYGWNAYRYVPRYNPHGALVGTKPYSSLPTGQLSTRFGVRDVHCIPCSSQPNGLNSGLEKLYPPSSNDQIIEVFRVDEGRVRQLDSMSMSDLQNLRKSSKWTYCEGPKGRYRAVVFSDNPRKKQDCDIVRLYHLLKSIPDMSPD